MTDHSPAFGSAPGTLTMIATRFHLYTFDQLIATGCGGHGIRIVPMSYDALFAAEALPGGTYIFTDIERLPAYERQLAAAAFRHMAAQPDRFRPLNDPAMVRTRYNLLRVLADAGLNDYDAYRAAGQPRPGRFPVFVRAESSHGLPLTGLLADQAALDTALAAQEQGGLSLDDLLVIEYAGEPAAPGLWRRYTAWRVAEAVVIGAPVAGPHWIVKDGSTHLDEALYRDDILAFQSGRHAAEARTAFDLARITYGRLDFGLLRGRVQVFEINSNPYYRVLDDHHPSATRNEGRLLVWREQMACLARLAAQSPSGEAASFDVPILAEFRRNNGGTATTWRP